MRMYKCSGGLPTCQPAPQATSRRRSAQKLKKNRRACRPNPTTRYVLRMAWRGMALVGLMLAPPLRFCFCAVAVAQTCAQRRESAEPSAGLGGARRWTAGRSTALGTRTRLACSRLGSRRAPPLLPQASQQRSACGPRSGSLSPLPRYALPMPALPSFDLA